MERAEVRRDTPGTRPAGGRGRRGDGSGGKGLSSGWRRVGAQRRTHVCVSEIHLFRDIVSRQWKAGNAAAPRGWESDGVRGRRGAMAGRPRGREGAQRLSLPHSAVQPTALAQARSLSSVCVRAQRGGGSGPGREASAGSAQGGRHHLATRLPACRTRKPAAAEPGPACSRRLCSWAGR